MQFECQAFLRWGSTCIILRRGNQLHRELENREPERANAAGISELSGLPLRYYRSPVIRERMFEFLGGAGLPTATAVYVAGNDGFSDFSEPVRPECLPAYLRAGFEVDRSLWDRDSLIADVDLEYHNFDSPAAAWLDPQRAFQAQQPVLEATWQILGRTGIIPLTLVSGRGFHLLWAIRSGSAVFRRLAALGYVTAGLEARYAQPCEPAGLGVEAEMGRAFAGLGLLMEFVGHRAMITAAPLTTLPVQPAAIEVGPGIHGREIISLDLSEYGDPLHTRQIRIPFSAYLKPRRFQWSLGEPTVRSLLPILEIPLGGMTLPEAIAVARNPDAAIELARRVSTAIPDASGAMENLLDEYQSSALAAFHERFHSELRKRTSAPADDDAMPIPEEPGCLRWLFEHPNDWLLKPAALQHIVRVLTALDWSPVSICQVIGAAYSREGDWGNVWNRLDPGARAMFYTRLFTGMIAMGTDTLIDFNCVSHREKGYCMAPECPSNLAEYRDMLLERKNR